CADAAAPQLSALSLHDALPISAEPGGAGQVAARAAAAPGAHDPRPAGASVAPAPERSAGALAPARRLGPAPDRRGPAGGRRAARSEEHTSELQSRENLVCRLLL